MGSVKGSGYRWRSIYGVTIDTGCDGSVVKQRMEELVLCRRLMNIDIEYFCIWNRK